MKYKYPAADYIIAIGQVGRVGQVGQVRQVGQVGRVGQIGQVGQVREVGLVRQESLSFFEIFFIFILQIGGELLFLHCISNFKI